MELRLSISKHIPRPRSYRGTAGYGVAYSGDLQSVHEDVGGARREDGAVAVEVYPGRLGLDVPRREFKGGGPARHFDLRGGGHGDGIFAVEKDGPVRENFYGRPAGKLCDPDGTALRELDQTVVLFENDIFRVAGRLYGGSSLVRLCG